MKLVLVIHPDLAQRNLTAELLQEEGFDVRAIGDCVEGIAVLNEGVFDALVVPANIDRDLDYLVKLRTLAPFLPIVLIAREDWRETSGGGLLASWLGIIPLVFNRVQIASALNRVIHAAKVLDDPSLLRSHP